MNIIPHQITIRELSEGYEEDFSTGSVIAYGGNLDVRPPYQREFVYKDKQRNAVIETAMNDYPLNVMYWAVRGDGTYEVMDGQQRTISICQYVQGDFSVGGKYFSNLPSDIRERFLDYALTVYFCDGTESEKLAWFRVINIAGEKLKEQEMRNAAFTGTWLSDAKKYFSNPNGMVYLKWKDYIAGEVLRQDYLETALGWIADGEILGGKEMSPDADPIADYMGRHQKDSDATELKLYFESVMGWTRTLFPKYRREMKTVAWGELYNRYKGGSYLASELERCVGELMADDDVQKKSGIYEYLLSGRENERALNIRAFTPSQKRAAYEKQGGICAKCQKPFPFEEMEGDHIVPWSKGGKTVPDNLQMLCRRCNGMKSDK